MKIEEINTEWSKDCSFNLDELATESNRIGVLHSKYYKIYIEEKLIWLKREEELVKEKQLRRDYYSGRMSPEELKEHGWHQFELTLLRIEVPEYIETDEAVLKRKLALALQHEKVEYLKSILASINQRSFNIRNAVEWKKFEAGN